MAKILIRVLMLGIILLVLSMFLHSCSSTSGKSEIVKDTSSFNATQRMQWRMDSHERMYKLTIDSIRAEQAQMRDEIDELKGEN